MTTGEKLVELSKLSGVSAGQHLLSFGTGVNASALLRSKSTLGTATAIQHLMAIVIAVPVPIGPPRVAGYTDRTITFREEQPRRARFAAFAMPR